MKTGIIGLGNMACAILGGMLKDGIVTKDELIGSAATEKTVQRIAEKYGIKTTRSNAEVASDAELLILAVKPQFLLEVINEIKDTLHEDTLLITIAAGKKISWYEEAFGRRIHLVRCMPNTPAMVGEGMTAACPNEHMTEEEIEYVKTLLSSFSLVEIVPEKLMDTVTAVSGSSPAYVFMFIEAMADAAVLDGMPRAQAYKFAAQAVLGSAKMVLDTGKHPGELKDMVCSPAGTTIDAVRVLEECGFRGTIIDAVQTCVEKSRSL